MIEIDARGMRCPWPALRLARAMRDLPPDGAVRLRADDPAAPREVAALAAEHGWRVTSEATDRWRIEIGSPRNGGVALPG